MSDKSEACPVCGTPVDSNVEEINKPSVEKQHKLENPVPNEQLMDTKGETSPAPAENNTSTATPPPITPSDKPAKKSNKTPIIIGIVAAVVVIGAFVAFLLLRNPKTNASKTQITAEAPIEAIEKNADPCLTVLNQLYNNYVFGNQFDQFGQVVDNLFTMKGKQKLLDAYDYDCETGDCYGIWALRTMAQDGDGESKIIDISQIGNGKYTVKYLDMGAMGETMVTFAEENGKMKIDDFRTIFDERYDENVGYMNEENLPRVYSNAYDGFVNIRQTPESKAPILGVLKNGPEGAVLLGREGEWLKIDCNGIVGYVYEKYVQDTPTEVFEYWGLLRKDASNYRFTENDLSPLTAKELTYLRNSVYAKHGYVFNSQELNNYFKRISWYHPNINVTDAVLNSVERTNVEFIKNYQERNGKTYTPQ